MECYELRKASKIQEMKWKNSLEGESIKPDTYRIEHLNVYVHIKCIKFDFLKIFTQTFTCRWFSLWILLYILRKQDGRNCSNINEFYKCEWIKISYSWTEARKLRLQIKGHTFVLYMKDQPKIKKESLEIKMENSCSEK